MNATFHTVMWVTSTASTADACLHILFNKVNKMSQIAHNMFRHTVLYVFSSRWWECYHRLSPDSQGVISKIVPTQWRSSLVSKSPPAWLSNPEGSKREPNFLNAPGLQLIKTTVTTAVWIFSEGTDPSKLNHQTNMMMMIVWFDLLLCTLRSS